MSQSPPLRVPQWSLADRFRKIRREVNLSQAEMADMLGVPRTAYTNWESGKSRPRELVPLARHIETTIGVPASWLMGMGAPPVELPKAASLRSLRALLEDQINDITHPVVRRYAEDGVRTALEMVVAEASDDPTKTVPITQRRNLSNSDCLPKAGQRVVVLPVPAATCTPFERRSAA